jgi:hypothetical protein
LINFDKPSLSVCAFGAGLAHAAALALILPILITLPAPADPAPQTVAIHVEILAAASTPIAQGDAEAAPLDALPPEDVTAALPSAAEPEQPDETMEPTVSQDALAPEPESDDDAQLGAVANVDTSQVPAVVPVPLRRPELNAAVEDKKPAKAAAPAPAEPKPRVTAYKPRSRVPAKPASKGFLGGHTATSMPEYPFSAGR